MNILDQIEHWANEVIESKLLSEGAADPLEVLISQAKSIYEKDETVMVFYFKMDGTDKVLAERSAISPEILKESKFFKKFIKKD